MKHLISRFAFIPILSVGLLAITFTALNWIGEPVLAEGGDISTSAATARVWVAHLAPFSNTITGTSVSVLVNGSPVLTDFKYPDTSGGYVDVPSGLPLTIQIVPTGVTTPAISATVTLTETEYTVAAIGNGASEFQKLDLLLLNDDNTAPTLGNGKVRVVHAAPFATIPALTEVDVLVDGTQVLTDFGYKEVSPYLEVPAGPHDVEVLALGGLLSITDTLVLTESVVVTVFAIGDNDNQPVAVLPIINREYTAKRYFPFVPKN